jgi:hypothetical protein
MIINIQNKTGVLSHGNRFETNFLAQFPLAYIKGKKACQMGSD